MRWKKKVRIIQGEMWNKKTGERVRKRKRERKKNPSDKMNG